MHTAIGYIAPPDKLAGKAPEIHADRELILGAAPETRANCAKCSNTSWHDGVAYLGTGKLHLLPNQTSPYRLEFEPVFSTERRKDMIQKLPSKVQSLIESIFPKVRPRKFAKFKPDFSAQPIDLLACKETQHKSRISAKSVVDYFLTREHPKFFFSRQQAHYLLRNKEYIGPGLKRVVISKAKFCCTKCLSVYSENINPINADFEWQSLEKFCSKDVLYLAKPHRFGFAPLLTLAILYGGNIRACRYLVILGSSKSPKSITR